MLLKSIPPIETAKGIFILIIAHTTFPLSPISASQYWGRAVRYANMIARYVSAWFAGLRFLSVPSGTEGIYARYASRT